jgi:hypothetical protein
MLFIRYGSSANILGTLNVSPSANFKANLNPIYIQYAFFQVILQHF